MINITGLSHVCINVDNIDEGIAYYRDLLNATPLQIFPRFKNEGFAKSAGFLENWENVEVSIAFLGLPANSLTIELMEYHAPAGQTLEFDLATTDKRRVGHIALKISGIDEAFEHVKSFPGTKMISTSDRYRPMQISKTEPHHFKFFDEEAEASHSEKLTTAEIISGIRYFYFIDRFGIQWECEEGHHDIGDQTLR